MGIFRNKLAQFKKGNLTDDETANVAEEIDKYEAITEYLDEQFNDTMIPIEEHGNSLYSKKISKSVNFKILRIAFVTVAILVILFASIIAGCNLYFYNPNTGIKPVYGGDGQLLLDMSSFTELHSPGYSTSWADAWRDGIGSYQVRIRQNNLFTGQQETESEQIIRGKALGNDDSSANNYWHFPLVNAFGYREQKVTYVQDNGEEKRSPDPEDLKWQLDALNELPKSCRVAVYVTFSNDLSLQQLSEMYTKWNENLSFSYTAIDGCGSYISSTLGFSPDSSGVILENAPDDEYPYLQLLGVSTEDSQRAYIWEQHFKSLLEYMSSRPEFLDSMVSVNGISSDYYRDVLAYVNENGINVYGALLHGNVDDILSFLGEESYSDFYVNDVKLSVFSDSYS